MVEALRIAPTPSLRAWADAKGYSSELVARWASFYPHIVELVKALERPPPRYIRLNPLAGDPQMTLNRLAQKGFEYEATAIDGGYLLHNEPFAVGATEEYLLGLYHIQDLSSQLAVVALEPQPHERVLDLAAAPGGKTIQIAQAMKNTGVIRAFDIDPTRSKAMRSNLGRCGVTNTIVHVAPGQDAARFEAWADRILLDAPCTGEGVIQRDPRRKRGSLTEYESCAKDQRELMDAAVKALKPGGVLVYSTCTLAPEENELQVQDALESHNLKLEPLPDPLAERAVGPQPLLAGLTRISQHELDPQIQLTRHALPHLNNCLGFYLARFRKGANE